MNENKTAADWRNVPAAKYRDCLIVTLEEQGIPCGFMVYDKSGNPVTAAFSLRAAKNAVNKMYPIGA